MQGQDPLVEMLIERKATLDKVAEGRPNDGRWPQYGGRAAGAAPLHLAAKAGFFEIVDRLLKAGAAVDITNSDSMTPLHLAMQEAKTNTSALLLSHGAKTDIPQVDGQTPLSLAIYSRDVGIVQQMISSGANVDRPAVASSRSLRYPLHLAAEVGAAHVLALLLTAKSQLEVTNRPEMETPLWTALRHPNVQATELLIKAGADIKRRHNRLSPLQYAVKTQQEEKARLLLEAGADPNEVDENGNSLLHHAVFRPPSMVALLLKNGAKPNVLNRALQSPLSLTQSGGGQTAPYGESSSRSLSVEARWAEFQESAELLRSHGADEFLRRRFEITTSRAATQNFGGQRVQVFSRGTNVLNNYTLYELLGSIFQNGGEGFRFPDFSNIRIRRLEGQKEVLIDVDAQEWLDTTNCARDVPLEWGDDVEIPMRVHLLGEGWNTLPPEQIGTLKQCLRRTVRVTVAGTNANVPLSPYFFSRHPGGGIPVLNTPPKFAFASLAVVVQRQPEVKALLRTSTDLTRVSVLRKESNGETRRMEFDITQVGLPDVNLGNTSLSSWMHDLWLRDGDVIEIPEKP
jgi:ankyrin repeat protein